MIPTLWNLFCPSNAPPPEFLRRLRDSDPMRTLTRLARNSMDPTLPSAVDHSVAQALRDALDVSIVDVLMSVWRRHPRLAEAAGGERLGGSMFAIGEHEVTSRHRPRVDVLGSEGALVSFEFEAVLDLQVQRATLVIERGQWLTRALPGACSGSGHLSLADHEIMSFDRPDLGLPDEIQLETLAPVGTDDATAPWKRLRGKGVPS